MEEKELIYIDIDENNYITTPYWGSIGQIDISDKELPKDFKENCMCYQYINEEFIFSEEKKDKRDREYLLNDLRQQRETECFSVINRGELWYNALTEEQKQELETWYQEWLSITNTLIIPEKPNFLN